MPPVPLKGELKWDIIFDIKSSLFNNYFKNKPLVSFRAVSGKPPLQGRFGGASYDY